MARIVICSWGSFGDLYPYIGLGIALRARGHQPRLALPRVYQPLVEGEGLDFAAVGPDIDIEDRELAARIMDPFKGTDVLFDELLVPSLARSHADLMSATSDADLLVTHPAALAGVIVAEERRLPWASSVLAPMSFFSASDPMVPPPAPWVHAWLARSPLLSRLALQLVRRITQKWAAPVAAFRASRGLPPRGNPILEGQHSPDLVLALFSKLLAAPQPDWPPHVRVTGAVLYNGAHAVEMPADLGEFLDSGPPPIVFTLGTSAIASAGDFYEVSAAAVERLNQRAVLLVGPHARNRPRALSDRIFLAEFVPHALVFPRAAAIVHQGGAGTMHQALASGRPTIVVPHAHDQPDNARRVTALGVARTIYPRQYRVTRLAADLRALIERSEYTTRAEQCRTAVLSEGGAAAAADAIDDLCRTHKIASFDKRH